MPGPGGSSKLIPIGILGQLFKHSCRRLSDRFVAANLRRGSERCACLLSIAELTVDVSQRQPDSLMFCVDGYTVVEPAERFC